MMDEKNLSIALLQLSPRKTEREALEVGLAKCGEAKALNAEIVLFPEMWNVGYRLPSGENEVEAWKQNAIDENSPFVQAFRGIARELRILVAITYLEKTDGLPRNSVAVIDKEGSIAHKYSKVHTCDFSSERWCSPGNGFPVTTLATSIGPVKIGTMICFDREFPESARLLMLNGAELILVPNACDIEQNRKNQLQTRAFENMVGVALANYADTAGNGHSLAFDGMAFGYDAAADTYVSRDQLLVEADDREGIFIAELPINRLRTYRKDEVWGNAYRKTKTYGLLTEPLVAEPFVRIDRKED